MEEHPETNPAWVQRYNAAFGRAMAFLEASHARAQAAEDAKARRRRVWVLNIAVVFFAMLTGILTWGREELARADDMSRQAREARANLQGLKAIGDLQRAREAGAVASDAWRVCARPPENAGTYSSTRQALLDKLCTPDSKLNEDDLRLIGIYEHVVGGRWRNASKGISQLSAGSDAEDGRQLLVQLATMRSPADRSERRFLLELRAQREKYISATPADEEQVRLASLAHPVHRRIAEELLTKPSGELAQEEKLLLDAYENAGAPRSISGSAADRERGKAIVDELSRLPHGIAYGELAGVALSPESQVIEGFDAGMNFLREFVWGIAVLMIWPLWPLRRFVQHRSGKPIRSRPNPMRRAAATVVDLAIAAGIGMLADFFVDAAVGIGGSLLKSPDRLSGWLDEAGVGPGFLAGMAYLLCRDAIRLRFRRSIGKAMFDLRPLVTNAADPGAMTVWASIKRNAIWLAFAVLVFLFTRYGLEPGHYLPSTNFAGDALLLGIGGATIFLLADVARSWFKDRDTLVAKWSKTRLIDADSAEALAIRP